MHMVFVKVLPRKMWTRTPLTCRTAYVVLRKTIKKRERVSNRSTAIFKWHNLVFYPTSVEISFWPLFWLLTTLLLIVITCSMTWLFILTLTRHIHNHIFVSCFTSWRFNVGRDSLKTEYALDYSARVKVEIISTSKWPPPPSSKLPQGQIPDIATALSPQQNNGVGHAHTIHIFR